MQKFTRDVLDMLSFNQLLFLTSKCFIYSQAFHQYFNLQPREQKQSFLQKPPTK